MSIGSVGQPLFQLGGLYSGLDTSGIVAKLVDLERMPETQMKNKQDLLTRQKTAWQEINTRLAAFNTAMSKLKDLSTWNTTKPTSSDPTVLSVSGASTVAGSYAIVVDHLATQRTFAVSGAASANTSLSSQGISGTLTVSTVDAAGATHTLTLQLDGTDLNSSGNTLNDVANAINNPVNGLTYGVTASVVQVSGGYALTITTNQTGASALVNQDGKTTVSTTSALTVSTPPLAVDAGLTVNGFAVTSSSNTVTGAIPGVSLTLQKSGSATVNLATDTAIARDAVKNMVDQYNALQDYIGKQLAYDAEQKTAGDLQGDPILQALQNKLRTMMGDKIENPTEPYHTLAALGISTSADDYGKSASLNLDTAKFDAAMASNPQSVANMFGAPLGLPVNVMTTGLAITVDNFIEPYTNYGGLLSSQTDTLTSQIDDLQERIDAWEQHVLDYQQRLTKEFTAMEKAMQEMQSQSASLLTQMTGWQNQTR